MAGDLHSTPPPPNKMNLRLLVFHSEHMHSIFIALSAVSAFFALRPTPVSAPIVLTLTILLLYSRILFHGEHAWKNTTILCLAIALGGGLSRLTASLDALSSPGVSLLVLFILSIATSILTLATIYLDTRLCTRLGGSWSQITLFPALWTTLWFAVTYVSPVGRLSAWSAIEGGGFYGWLAPFLGPAGYDWVVAAWAVVCFQAIGAWYMGANGDKPLAAHNGEEELLIAHNAPVSEQPKPWSLSGSTLLLGCFLILLSIPSFLLNDLPLATLSPTSTPLSVGCVLPSSQRYKHISPTLNDFIVESRKMTSSAKILLWPEGAVTFNTETEKNEGLARVQELLNNSSSYVGVSFEETFRDPGDGSRRSSSRRTGLAIISRTSKSPHLVYYKRHLVPIAESFSLSHSKVPPSIFTLELERPKGMNQTDWEPKGNHTRPIPLTASICLDFSDPFLFAELDSRPALVLAPARTWDISVGHAMWQQARQRAAELRTMILWCDGGDGGVSGVAGGGFHDFTQVGLGSWVKTVGIQYPFDERRTAYASYLGYLALLLFWALVFGSSLGDYVYLVPTRRLNIHQMVQRVGHLFSKNRSQEGDLLG